MLSMAAPLDAQALRAGEWESAESLEYDFCTTAMYSFVLAAGDATMKRRSMAG